MNKLLIAIVVGLIFSLGRYSYSADQAHSLGTVTLNIRSQTLTQIVNSTATTVGQLVYCSNCTQSPICVSTGTTVFNQYAVMTSSLAAGGYQTCK